MLARAYDLGLGVPRTVNESIRFYRKAANAGHSEAQKILGTIYMSGDGVHRDITTGMKWWRRSAARGNLEAQALIDRNVY